MSSNDRSETFTHTYQAMVFSRLQIADDEDPAMVADFDALIDRAARRISREQRARVAAAAAVFHQVLRASSSNKAPVEPPPAPAYAAPAPPVDDEATRLQMHAHSLQTLSFARAQLADGEDPALLDALDVHVEQLAEQLPESWRASAAKGLELFRKSLTETPIGWLRVAQLVEVREEPEAHASHQSDDSIHLNDMVDYDPEGGEHGQCAARVCQRRPKAREQGWLHVAENERSCYVLCPEHAQHVTSVARALTEASRGRPS